jgi:hypothetical protein
MNNLLKYLAPKVGTTYLVVKQVNTSEDYSSDYAYEILCSAPTKEEAKYLAKELNRPQFDYLIKGWKVQAERFKALASLTPAQREKLGYSGPSYDHPEFQRAIDGADFETWQGGSYSVLEVDLLHYEQQPEVQNKSKKIFSDSSRF